VAEKKARCRELLELGQRLQAKSHAHALGQVAEVLLEHGSASRPAEGPTILYGYTPDYLRVECTLPDHVPVQEAAGRLLPLRLVEDAGEHLRGEWTAFAMAHAKTHP
jgi:tRNA A37 methylthiotransferase MiaB